MFFAILKKKHLIVAVSLFICIAIIATILFSGGIISTSGYATRKLPIYRVNTNEKKVAITFDCAWGTDYTQSLLDTMEKEKVVCTFFAVEFWVNKHPDFVKKIDEYGHEWGTHSSTHPYMSKLSKSAIEKELTTSRQAIESITGKRVEVFRAPYGDYNDLVIDTAKSLGLYTIQWDVDSLDWKDLSASSICERVLSRVKNGSIVLFHNQGLHTYQALPTIISSLKAKGYTFVKVGDLIYRENYVMLSDGSQQLN